MLHILLSYPRSLMSFMSLIPIIPLYQAGRMVAEDLELTVETLRCREDREASGLVKKVRQFFTHQSDLVNLSNKTNIDFFQSSADLQIWHFTSHIIVLILLFAWYWNPRNPSDRWEILFGLQSASSTDDFQRDRIQIQIRWADTFTFCIYFDFLFPVDLLLFLLSLSLSESSNAKPKRKHHRCGVTHRVRCWEGRGNSGLL